MPKADRVPFSELHGGDAGQKEQLNKIHTWLGDSETSLPETLWREEAIEDYRFYAGDQDTDDVKLELQEKNRPATVFNEVKPKIDMLVGLAAQTRFEGELIPVGVEDEALAELMNGALKHFRRKIGQSRTELECFEHTVKSGRSLFYFWIDKSNPFSPKIKCKRIPGTNFFLDPDSIEYNLSDARYLFIDNWLTEEELDTLGTDIDTSMIMGHAENATGNEPVYFNQAKDKYRLVECWYRKWVKVRWFVNPMTKQPEKLSPKDFGKLMKIFEAGVPSPENPEELVYPTVDDFMDTFEQQVHYMLFSGPYIFEGGPSPYLMEGFPAVLFGAYKDEDNNKWFSATTMMKDPQRAINTMRRQLSHLLQTLPKGILIHEVGAILDPEAYEENSADPSYHMEVAKGMLDKVKFQQQPQISPVYQTYDMTMSQSMKDASGIQNEMMGVQTTSREPGVSVRMRQETGLSVLYVAFNNYKESRRATNTKLVSLIQQYVTEPQLIRIEGQKGAQLIAVNNQMNPQSQGFNDLSAGEFDMVMDETLENATMRMAIAQILTDFSHNNPGSIPPDVLLEYSNVPYTVKMQVKEFWEAQRKLEQENIEADRAVEIMKIKVGKQSSKDEAK